MKHLVTATLLICLIIFWPRDILSVDRVEPYFREGDYLLIILIVCLWLGYGLHKIIELLKGSKNG